jgi:hypothetical protein
MEALACPHQGDLWHERADASILFEEKNDKKYSPFLLSRGITDIFDLTWCKKELITGTSRIT